MGEVLVVGQGVEGELPKKRRAEERLVLFEMAFKIARSSWSTADALNKERKKA